MSVPTRRSWPSHRPAPRNATGAPKPITDDVTWTRHLKPRESYQIEYIDRHGEIETRIIDVLRLGSMRAGVSEEIDYLGVMHQGKFKTLRADRIRAVRQLTEGHEPSIAAFPQYADPLPVFPIPGAVYKVATIALSTRKWTVDLNAYTCTCPEKRERAAKKYVPGQLGHVCPHIARAIIEHLPPTAAWPPALLKFLGNPRRVHIDNLV